MKKETIIDILLVLAVVSNYYFFVDFKSQPTEIFNGFLFWFIRRYVIYITRDASKTIYYCTNIFISTNILRLK